MIAKLTGLVDSAGEDWAVLDVGGVGYLLFCSSRTLSRLPRIGEAARLFVETHVREDHIHLYGFADEEERAWFRLLQTVQGVGSKVALAILSTLSAADLGQAIAAGDKAMLSRPAGVGPKLAARLAVELKDKVGTVLPAGAFIALPEQVGAALEDAVSALVNLGYRRAEAQLAVVKASSTLGVDAKTPALIRAGLQELGREVVR
jgi:Holliday junction DNA helicase RuvA